MRNYISKIPEGHYSKSFGTFCFINDNVFLESKNAQSYLTFTINVIDKDGKVNTALVTADFYYGCSLGLPQYQVRQYKYLVNWKTITVYDFGDKIVAESDTSFPDDWPIGDSIEINPYVDAAIA